MPSEILTLSAWNFGHLRRHTSNLVATFVNERGVLRKAPENSDGGCADCYMMPDRNKNDMYEAMKIEQLGAERFMAWPSAAIRSISARRQYRTAWYFLAP
jgi:hypothetical protein